MTTRRESAQIKIPMNSKNNSVAIIGNYHGAETKTEYGLTAYPGKLILFQTYDLADYLKYCRFPAKKLKEEKENVVNKYSLSDKESKQFHIFASPFPKESIDGYISLENLDLVHLETPGTEIKSLTDVLKQVLGYYNYFNQKPITYQAKFQEALSHELNATLQGDQLDEDVSQFTDDYLFFFDKDQKNSMHFLLDQYDRFSAFDKDFIYTIMDGFLSKPIPEREYYFDDFKKSLTEHLTYHTANGSDQTMQGIFQKKLLSFAQKNG